MIKFRYRVCVIFLMLFCAFSANCRKRNPRHKKSSVTRHTPAVSYSLEHSMPWKEISKKSLIEHGVVNRNVERKQKRGFLSNLANLLNDAEVISGHHKDAEKSAEPVALASYTLAPEKNLVEVAALQDEKDTIQHNTPSLVKKETVITQEAVPSSAKEVNEAVADSGKDFAPVFAMYHGKVVTLGKLPDTAFKRSHLNYDQTATATTSTDNSPRDKHVNEPDSHVIDVVGSKRYLEDSSSSIMQNQQHAAKRDSQLNNGGKLQDYLKTLDSEKVLDVSAVPKNEVPGGLSSLDASATSHSDLMGHIKGVVLDNGNVVSVNNNHMTTENSVQHNDVIADSQQKYYVTNDGSVEPLIKSRPENVEAVQRDNLYDTLNGNGQKTVTLTVDVLKNLLKKTDSKVSLANLLNKQPDVRSDTQEDEDPGTIEDFAAGGLKSHNNYRARHHDDTLIWSDELAAKAQKLAESLADKKTLEIAKDLEKDGMGENVAKVWATFKNAGDAATKMWYSQSSNYRFDDPHLDENTGQFAQLIWKSTKELGMGVAKSIDDVNNKYVYVTALYRPPGNIESTLRDNVLPTGNNTVDVYTTFFKRTGVSKETTSKISKRSKIQRHTKRKRVKLRDKDGD